MDTLPYPRLCHRTSTQRFELRVNGVQSVTVIKAKIYNILINHNLEIDYVAICDSETLDEIIYVEKTAIVLITAYCENIRLIDNALI